MDLLSSCKNVCDINWKIINMFNFFRKLKEKRLTREAEERKALEILDKIIKELELDRDCFLMDLEEQVRSKLNEEEGYDYFKNGIPNEVPPPCPEKFDKD